MLKTTLSLCPSQLKNGLSFIYSNAKQIPLSTFNRLHHCCSNSGNRKKMKIHVLPALKDNFMYLIVDKETNEAAVVDPVTPNLVLCVVKENNYNLKTILTTHHHWDHAGGNKALASSIPDLMVYGGDTRIEALNCKVSHGTKIKIGSVDIECLHTPCHTTGHISYYVTKDCADPVVFTGDTLFIGGCGRFFEGTGEQMFNSLNEILGKLPNETKVYCGHEYTINNLKFGLHVEPNNQAIKEKMVWACNQQKKNLHTVPSTISEEKLINPFMRVCEPSVQQHTGKCDPIEVIICLRAEKDCF